MTWAWLLVMPADERWGSGFREAMPKNTNNVAEYYALGTGLIAVTALAVELPKPEQLIIRGDSKLVVEQMNGTWECRKPQLIELRDRCLKHLEKIEAACGRGTVQVLQWVPREENARADQIGRDEFLKRTGREMPNRRRSA